MRLLYRDDSGGTGKLSLAEFVGEDIPPYAILSHTWGTDNEEVTYRDISKRIKGHEEKLGYKKLQFCVQKAAERGLKYSWG